MGCNCGSKKKPLTSRRPGASATTNTTTQPRMQGTTQSFAHQPSRLEIEAARRRRQF